MFIWWETLPVFCTLMIAKKPIQFNQIIINHFPKTVLFQDCGVKKINEIKPYTSTIFSSVQFSCSVVSDSLRPHELQHARPPCPSPTPGFHPNPNSLLSGKRFKVCKQTNIKEINSKCLKGQGGSPLKSNKLNRRMTESPKWNQTLHFYYIRVVDYIMVYILPYMYLCVYVNIYNIYILFYI